MDFGSQLVVEEQFAEEVRVDESRQCRRDHIGCQSSCEAALDRDIGFVGEGDGVMTSVRRQGELEDATGRSAAWDARETPRVRFGRGACICTTAKVEWKVP